MSKGPDHLIRPLLTGLGRSPHKAVTLGVGAGLVLVDRLAILGSAPDRMALDIVGHWSVPAIVSMQGRGRVVARPEAARRAGVENVQKFAMTWT